ncbi:MAG: hypothetical protein Q9M30_05585, partial [Mariprofundaceae bacterium]|nr:hypothetical protein [Mariprofundaceae bacterium]
TAAEMLVSAAACICSHRPALMDDLLPDFLEPLIDMDILYPNEIMAWYASNEQLASEVMLWIEQAFEPRLNWVGATVDGNRALLEFVGLPEVKNIAAVAPKYIRMTNYSEVWGNALMFVLLMLPFAALPLFAQSPGIFIFCATAVALTGALGVKQCRGKLCSLDMGEELVLRRFLQAPQRYTPEDIRHIGLRNERAKLYYILTMVSHEFVDIEFFDGDEAGLRMTGRECAHLMLYLAARGLSSRMSVKAGREGMVGIIPVFTGLIGD